MAMMDSLIQARQVAHLLGIKISTVYALCQGGQLPYVVIARRARRNLIRFRLGEIENLLAERSVPVVRDDERAS
jgi:predicted DNA-binding transcriptional regulator AlpA